MRSLLRNGVRALTDAVQDGLLKESELDTAVGRLLEARFRLGMFDPPALVPYAKIPATEYDTPEHDTLALRMARESVVLLKNDGLLPLDRAKIHKIAVLGFNANYVATLLGNYDGEPSHPVTFAARHLGSPRHQRAGLLRAGLPAGPRVGDTNQAAYDDGPRSRRWNWRKRWTPLFTSAAFARTWNGSS